jgi:hypothetical protein
MKRMEKTLFGPATPEMRTEAQVDLSSRETSVKVRGKAFCHAGWRLASGIREPKPCSLLGSLAYSEDGNSMFY